jgi:spore coat-associated protein N
VTSPKDTPAPPGKTLLGGTGRKVLLSLGALGVAGALAGMGTFATFTATTSASSTLASGTVVIALGNTGASTNRLTVNASGLVPGDTVQRSFDLSNTGSQDLASVALTTTASPSSLLDTDSTNGLQMVVDRCSVAWTESGSSPAFSYTCGGSTTTILTTRAVIQSALTMSGLSALTAAGTDHLRLTLTFPGTAGASLQGLSSTLTYSFLGTQRAGAAH